MQQIHMASIRKGVLAAYGKVYKWSNYDKLPADFSTHPFWVSVNGYIVKVLSSKEARESSKTKAKNPQRILTWCVKCQRWVFAGKLVQHRKFHKKGEK